jgi:hypothetical protein
MPRKGETRAEMNARRRESTATGIRLRQVGKVEEPTVDEQRDRHYRRIDSDNAGLRKLLAARTKTMDEALDIRDGVFGLKLEDVTTPPEWTVDPYPTGGGWHTPIIFTSDLQFGEVVSGAELNGMNEYNSAIFAKRYDKLITKAIRWCDAIADGWDAKFRGCIYLRGGDEISGSIHEELAETNDFSAVPAVRELVRYERAGILRLKERFGSVHVISIPGNHGRTTLKPRAKKYVELNFETLISWWLADSLSGEEGITHEIPESGDAYFQAEGWRFLMSHGDRMGSRGGTGFIGPIATIARGHQKLRMAAAASGQPVDVVLTGHLHTSVKTEWGYANGSMVGYSEYANTLRCEPDSAKQWLLLAHCDRVYGIEIELSDKPRRAA